MFKFIVLDRVGRVDRVVERFSRTEAEAITLAESFRDAATVEVWRESSLIARVILGGAKPIVLKVSSA